MKYERDNTPLFIHGPGIRRVLDQQYANIEWFEQIESSMQPLWAHCEERRSKTSRQKQPGQTISDDQLQQLVEQCTTAMLNRVQAERVSDVCAEASDRLDACLGDWVEQLGDDEMFATNELYLRLFIALALQAASEGYRAEVQVATWGEAIRDAESIFATNLEAWKDVASRRSRRRPVSKQNKPMEQSSATRKPK
jgi:hypothetical protein